MASGGEKSINEEMVRLGYIIIIVKSIGELDIVGMLPLFKIRYNETLRG